MGNLSPDIKRQNREEDLRLAVNLAEMFDLPYFPRDDELRQVIGQAILDKIKENTGDGVFLAGSSRKGYSKEYAESDEGVVYGKKAGAKPNLQASGDMLDSISVELPDNKNKVDLYFIDSGESQKAHGHVNGRDILPKRDFFGLTNQDLRSIARKFDDEVNSAFAIELAGETGEEQGSQSDLEFITRLLDEG